MLLLAVGAPFAGAALAVGLALATRRFMPGCTHAGVAKGTTCPLCGRTV